MPSLLAKPETSRISRRWVLTLGPPCGLSTIEKAECKRKTGERTVRVPGRLYGEPRTGTEPQFQPLSCSETGHGIAFVISAIIVAVALT
jgi:hypothetical protein